MIAGGAGRRDRRAPADARESALAMAWHDARAERDRLVNRALLRLEMRGELDRPLVRRIADLNAQLEAMRHLRQWLRERG